MSLGAIANRFSAGIHHALVSSKDKPYLLTSADIVQYLLSNGSEDEIMSKTIGSLGLGLHDHIVLLFFFHVSIYLKDVHGATLD